MLKPSILLDAAMTAAGVLERLARNGIWLRSDDPAAQAWIRAFSGRLGISSEEAAQRLARPAQGALVTIRRRVGPSVLWYVRPAEAVLKACAGSAPGLALLDVLNLHEHQRDQVIPLEDLAAPPPVPAVVMDGGAPVGVSLPAGAPVTGPAGGEHTGAPALPQAPLPPAPAPRGVPERPLGRRMDPVPAPATPTAGVSPPAEPKAAPPPPPLPAPVPVPREAPPPGGAAAPPEPEPAKVEAFPRVDAPTYVPARTEFVVRVGLAREAQLGVVGGRMTFEAPRGASSIDVDVHLVASGLDAPDGWIRRLVVPVSDPASAQVEFRLIGRDPVGPDPVCLTTLELRYVSAGTVCGAASRPLVIGPAGQLAAPAGPGPSWSDQPAVSSPVALRHDALAADLTLEIAKVDGDATSGRFMCSLYSPHPLATGSGPFSMDLGDDAKSFAGTYVQQLDTYGTGALVDNVLTALGDLIATSLPAQVVAALHEVAKRTAPAPPTVLLVSAEPYVPWELAAVNPPLDPARPGFLGAQAIVGRWLPPRVSLAPRLAPARPPVQPPAHIPVHRMAVVKGIYRAASRLRSLPNAESEADGLVREHHAIALDATVRNLKTLLDAQVPGAAGGVDAVHFAGHGAFDTAQADASMLYLSDGKPISSFLFRSARYGGQQQPLLFLNACMAGIGDELLGNLAGFPGNCLSGGFGGMVGALWAIDDGVAEEVALEFWRRALPPSAGGQGPEPVGAILRDLRGRYDPAMPISTYLAYVYYGHPRLTLA